MFVRSYVRQTCRFLCRRLKHRVRPSSSTNFGVMAGDQLFADPGVAVNQNVENATADAVAILPIVFITFSNKLEPPWAPATIAV